jgi:hypothetical protein
MEDRYTKGMAWRTKEEQEELFLQRYDKTGNLRKNGPPKNHSLTGIGKNYLLEALLDSASLTVKTTSLNPEPVPEEPIISVRDAVQKRHNLNGESNE